MAKQMQAKFAGRCRSCGERIEVGSHILWSKAEGARHVNCGQQASSPDPDPELYYDNDSDEAEYQRGRAEAEQYQMNRRLYGARLAEQWEMEAELARYNRGDDY
jgi:hypothetical protein